jgi:HSP20 family protein
MANGTTSPLRDFLSLRDAMNRMFDDRWVSPGAWLTWAGAGSQYLPLDVYETPDDIVVRALVPGATPEGIDVHYQHWTLTIRTTTQPPELEDGATWLVQEISAGQALRQVTLPRTVDIDHVRTTFENGILTLVLPKTADAKPRQIRVGSPREIGVGTASH